MKNGPITQEFIRTRVLYEPESGSMVWLPKPVNSHFDISWNKKFQGKEVGSITKGGYRIVWINEKHHYVHRLAWLYMTGLWPVNDLDHINGDSSDNRFSNLREATTAQNIQNRLPISTNKTGVTGVHQRGKRWVASIISNNVTYHLGTFDSFEEATAARYAAEDRLHGQFAGRLRDQEV